MRIIPVEKIESAGKCMLLYGETGVGKTTSVLLSCKEPICFFKFEGKSIAKPYEIFKQQRPDAVVEFWGYEGFEDLIETVNDYKRFEKFKTIIVDNVTDLCNNKLLYEIVGQAHEARKTGDDKQKKFATTKSLTSEVKTSEEDYGTLAGHMVRLSDALNRLSQEGHDIIATALLKEDPKWNVDLFASANFAGKAYNKNSGSFWDYSGIVMNRYKDKKIVYPPKVYFKPHKDLDNENFHCRFAGSSEHDGKVILNIEKILKL